MTNYSGLRTYRFEDTPRNRDLFLMDEIWRQEYETMLLEMIHDGQYRPVGYVGYIAVRAIDSAWMELSWYPNTHDRFHEINITLTRDQFVNCVDCPEYDVTPVVFVKSNWLRTLYLRAYSVFALVDAIGIKKALRDGTLDKQKLTTLRNLIDEIASRYDDVLFVSFADSLLLKSNWHVGMHDSTIKYTYRPELFIELIQEIRSAYREALGMDVYAILTQGNNEHYDEPLLHRSSVGNHISLNSLGVPFAQLMAIETAARDAIRRGVHAPATLYMDEYFYHSLKFKAGFSKDERSKHVYVHPMSVVLSEYYFSSPETLSESLELAS